MGDVEGVATGRSRREERIRVPEDRPKVDATYVTVLNSLRKSLPISGVECFFLKECDFAKLDEGRRGRGTCRYNECPRPVGGGEVSVQ